MVKILDCTLRDGGYYNNWDFSPSLVSQYCDYISQLPIDYIEIGYRSEPKKEYFGQYFYLPISTIKNIKNRLSSKQKIAVMLNYKDLNSDNLPKLLSGVEGIVDLVRIATPCGEIQEALKISALIKNLGFEVGINLMYLSQWSNGDLLSISTALENGGQDVDFIYLVDSYGGVTPLELRGIIKKLKESVKIPMGFHGHNNIELAFANAIVCLEEELGFIDSTVLGMGRGAGNLKTELILTYLQNRDIKSFNYSELSGLVSLFEPLLEYYRWGTNFAYMVSGSKSLPQQNIMDWLSTNRYSIDDIVAKINPYNQELRNEFREIGDISGEELRNKKFLIVGGGSSVLDHKNAIEEFLKNNSEIVLLYSSTHHIDLFVELKNKKILCLVESKNNKITTLGKTIIQSVDCFIDLASGNKKIVQNQYYELAKTKIYSLNTTAFAGDIDSPLAISMQVAINLKFASIFLVGFDGYDKGHSYGKYILHQETQNIIDGFGGIGIGNIFSITPSKYIGVKMLSIYSMICNQGL